MAKYSTNTTQTSTSDGTVCELCGTTTETLTTAEIAGADLSVCESCSPHDESTQTTDSESSTKSESTDAIMKATDDHASLWDRDTRSLEQNGPKYTDDRLPHLISDYGEQIKDARITAGLTETELADELDIEEMTIITLEQGSAVEENIGGSVIRKLEEKFDIVLRKTPDSV